MGEEICIFLCEKGSFCCYNSIIWDKDESLKEEIMADSEITKHCDYKPVSEQNHKCKYLGERIKISELQNMDITRITEKRKV